MFYIKLKLITSLHVNLLKACEGIFSAFLSHPIDNKANPPEEYSFKERKILHREDLTIWIRMFSFAETYTDTSHKYLIMNQNVVRIFGNTKDAVMVMI